MNLDDDIAAWAAAVRLPAADADAIFRQIMATEPARSAAPVRAVTASSAHVLATTAPGLGGAWWRQQAAGFAARMVAATAPLTYAA